MANSAFVAVTIMLAALMVLQAQPSTAEIMSSMIEDLPSGLELRRELSAQMFLAREDKRRCVAETRRNRGYYFVPVVDGESGVTFDRCEIGERRCRWRCAESQTRTAPSGRRLHSETGPETAARTPNVSSPLSIDFPAPS